MDSHFSHRSRAERLIAGGRVVLAASSLFAVWRDPSEPAKYASIAYFLLLAYLVYAIGVALVVWRKRAPTRLQGWLTHIFDLVFFSVFMYFTSGPASPFIAYYVFALVCATLRWQRQGTLWTAVASLASFLGLGYYFAEVLRDPTFELNEFIIRGVYMTVVALLLGYLGAHEERSRLEVSLLAAWPQAVPQAIEQLIADQLAYVAKVLAAPAVVLFWQRRNRLPVSMAAWSGAALRTEERPDLALDHLLAAGIGEGSLLAPEPARQDGEVLLHDSSGFRRWRGAPLAPALLSEFGSRPLLSLPMQGELISGRLFILEKRQATSDDLLLGEVCAAVVGGRLDHLLLIERFQQAAATEERIRLARDLHDGVLQSFTGFGLRVAAIRRLLEDRSAEVEVRLQELQRLVAVEQRDLRFLIQELEPSASGGEEDFMLENRLAELLTRVEQEWQLRVSLESVALPEELADDAARDIYHLIREALVNAVRHGDATQVEIRLAGGPASELAIRISDNGHGFPFRGRFDHEQLAATQTGPRSLRERVIARGGSLILESSADGARLEIVVPV